MRAEQRTTRVAKLAGAALVLLLVLWARAGCDGPDVEAPRGFARLGEAGLLHRSLSPDGVVFRVRVEPHAPRADLAFWREAMRRHLLGAGYRLVEEGEVTAAGPARGYRIELAAPYGGEDFRYLVALFVTDDDLLVVEASGEEERFDARRASILDAIARIEVPS